MWRISRLLVDPSVDPLKFKEFTKKGKDSPKDSVGIFGTVRFKRFDQSDCERMGKWNSSTLALQNALTWALWPPRWLEKMWGRCGEDMGCVINMRERRWLKSKGSSMAIWRHHDFWLVYYHMIRFQYFHASDLMMACGRSRYAIDKPVALSL